MDWFVGQKVVCVSKFDDEYRIKSNKLYSGIVFPQIGEIYTIRSIIYIDELGFLFEEIKNLEYNFGNGIGEPKWVYFRFKPLVEKNTDISIFTDILNKINKTCKENVQ